MSENQEQQVLHKGRTRDLLRGAGATGAAKVVSIVLTFGFNVLVARELGVNQVGLFFVATAVVVVLAVLSRLGYDKAIIKHASAAMARDDWATVGAQYFTTLAKVAVIAGAFSATFALAGDWIAGSVFGQPGLAAFLPLMALAVLPLALMHVHAQFVKASGRVAFGFLVQNGAVSAFMLGSLLLLRGAADAQVVAVAYVGASVAALGVIAAVWLRAARFAALRQGAGQPSRDIDGSSRALFFVSLVNQIVLPWGAILLLGALGTERDAGQFGVAYRLAMLVNFAYLAVESILGPRLAVLCAGNDMAAVQDLAGRGTTVVWIIALPLACLLLLLPEVALAWFGADFVAAAPVLLILVGGQCANVLTGSVQQLLVMSNYVQDFRNVCIASGAANVLLGIIFIPSLGAIGAAVAVAGAIAVQNVAAVYFVWHRLGFIPLPVIFGRRS